ncbi:MAG: efflux RND transporter periplasmic adaptor subunit [Anaerolineae bacterium]|nr:efflux RND transporter periplasmic adaptor subunit [Anaerolineae bacterium]MBT7323675.1 efflux RND transporter periplasmic adaptor subunit [Anaerolineae bacterium]
MKFNRWLFLLAIFSILSLAACGALAPAAEPIPTVVLDTQSSESSSGGNSGEVVTASARVLPINAVELSFPLVGSVVDVMVSTGDMVNAGDALVQLDTAILQANVREAEASRTTAETQVSYLKRINNSSTEDILAAEAEVQRHQALVDAAIETLAQATLITPIGGTVASVDIEKGETVTPGLLVVTVGDLSEMKLETTDLSERDVPQVQIGQSTEIYVDALDSRFSGIVTEIAHQASSIGGDVVYTVTIHFNEQIPELRWGMSAEVDISVGE